MRSAVPELADWARAEDIPAPAAAAAVREVWRKSRRFMGLGQGHGDRPPSIAEAKTVNHFATRRIALPRLLPLEWQPMLPLPPRLPRPAFAAGLMLTLLSGSTHAAESTAGAPALVPEDYFQVPEGFEV